MDFPDFVVLPHVVEQNFDAAAALAPAGGLRHVFELEFGAAAGHERGELAAELRYFRHAARRQIERDDNLSGLRSAGHLDIE